MSQIESERDPSLSTVIRGAMKTRLMDLHTALPGKIVTYDKAKGIADIQPLIQQRRRQPDGTFEAKDFPIARGCPVAFPRCAGGYITFPLAADDLGLLIFCEREIGDWVQKSAGESVDPGDGDLHPLTGAVFYPGLYPATSALSPEPSGSDLEIVSTGNTNIGAAGLTADDRVAIAKLVSDALSTLKNAISTAAVAAGDGGATFKSNIIGALTTWPPNLAATKVRAK